MAFTPIVQYGARGRERGPLSLAWPEGRRPQAIPLRCQPGDVLDAIKSSPDCAVNFTYSAPNAVMTLPESRRLFS